MRSARAIVLAALAAALVLTPAAAAPGGFVEPVQVLYTLEDPTPGVEGLFGWEVATLSDLNGDGVSELLVGEPDTETGSAYVYSGRDGALIYALPGEESDFQGYAVEEVGDVNGDGASDFIAGAIRHASLRGVARVYSGATGELLRAILGPEPRGVFGLDAIGLGDVDADGVPDFAVSAVRAGGTGRAYVYSGRTFTAIHTLSGERNGDLFGTALGRVADLDGDGANELVVGARHAGDGARGEVYVYSGRTGERLLEVAAPPTGKDFGWFFATGVGDIDGDGAEDVYVGDFEDTSRGVSTGRVTVFSGRDGSTLHTFVGAQHHEGLGPGRSAGDVDGDGVPDLVVGSYKGSAGAGEAGMLEVFSGADGALLRRITSTRADEQLGFDAMGFEDLNGDGVPELVGAAAQGDRVYVFAGVAP